MTTTTNGYSRCTGCGGSFPDTSGAVHRYVESSPGCWAVYGEVLVREYSDAAYYGVHRLTVDAYSAQHPGRPSAQSIQSVAIHLISLCLTMAQGRSMDQATRAMGRATKAKADFRWLEPPPVRGSLTVSDVHRARSATEHAELARLWAAGVWDAWSPHHATVQGWAAQAVPGL